LGRFGECFVFPKQASIANVVSSWYIIIAFFVGYLTIEEEVPAKSIDSLSSFRMKSGSEARILVDVFGDIGQYQDIKGLTQAFAVAVKNDNLPDIMKVLKDYLTLIPHQFSDKMKDRESFIVSWKS
jgi:hypothetical protein